MLKRIVAASECVVKEEDKSKIDQATKLRDFKEGDKVRIVHVATVAGKRHNNGGFKVVVRRVKY